MKLWWDRWSGLQRPAAPLSTTHYVHPEFRPAGPLKSGLVVPWFPGLVFKTVEPMETRFTPLSSLRTANFQSAASCVGTKLLMAVAGLALTLATLFTHS